MHMRHMYISIIMFIAMLCLLTDVLLSSGIIKTAHSINLSADAVNT